MRCKFKQTEPEQLTCKRCARVYYTTFPPHQVNAQCRKKPGPIRRQLARFRPGTALAVSLGRVGVTPARIERVTGSPCRCPQRQAAVDKWWSDRWA